MTERFTLISELGRGGMGVVWKARDEETGQLAALKVMREAYAEDADYVVRFERELELAKRIHSRNVVQVLGFGVRDGRPYLALEFINGKTLREHLLAHGPYVWAETKPLLAQVAQGLADAHAAGVIHRDLKPSNILIGSDGTIKLADFGIAKGVDLTRMTATSAMLGTPTYLAPEGPLDERSDLYSLGIIAFEVLSGVVPFEGRTHQEVILRHVREAPNLARLPEEARPIVGWLLAKNPTERPQRASALLPVLWSGVAAPPPHGPAPQYAAPPPHGPAPQYAAPPPHGPAPQYAAPPPHGPAPMPALLASSGGVAALVSAFLPWVVMGDAVLRPNDTTLAVDDLIRDPMNLANGDYLLVGAVLAAIVGVALLLKLTPKFTPILAISAIAAGVLIVGVETSVYVRVIDVIKQHPTFSIGSGLYVGALGGAAVIVGGLTQLAARSLEASPMRP
jgi:eukaryotic-like serine/threonine-protein kinase